MNEIKNLKAKVINTLNILSEQDITETKLYKTILTASEEEKKALIQLSSTFAGSFFKFGKYLKTTEIYKWLKILINRFEVEEGIKLDYIISYYKSETIQNDHPSYDEDTLEELYGINFYNFNAYDYATFWFYYFEDDRSEIEKIVKIIQPMELFILTAVTIMAIACHIGQKPFEVYANMDFKSVLCALTNDYRPLHKSTYERFQKADLQYNILHSLVNGKYSNDNKSLKIIVLEARFMDEFFGKIINVSEKSEYEKLKTLYEINCMDNLFDIAFKIDISFLIPLLDNSPKEINSEGEWLDSLCIFTNEDLTEEKVINTLNILSEREVTETELYKTILSADQSDKEFLIKCSSSFAKTFAKVGLYLKTFNIYSWLKMLFDRFKAEEGIDIKDYYRSREYRKIERLKDIYFNCECRATYWCMYFEENISNVEKIAKIIQPMELFILTAITVLPIACHISQKPFEHYANMDFKSVINILSSDYYPHNELIYDGYQFTDARDSTSYECSMLYHLVNGETYKKTQSFREAVLIGHLFDESFADIIKVSEKSEYEKFKTLYKK